MIIFKTYLKIVIRTKRKQDYLEINLILSKKLSFCLKQNFLYHNLYKFILKLNFMFISIIEELCMLF